MTHPIRMIAGVWYVNTYRRVLAGVWYYPRARVVSAAHYRYPRYMAMIAHTRDSVRAIA